MKKRVILLAGLMVMVLCGCGNKATEPQTPEEFLREIDEEREREQAEREQEVMDQAAAEDGYVEGIIPAGRYYKDGDTSSTCWEFYTDEKGSFSIKGHDGTRGTYEYNSETGIYSLDYDTTLKYPTTGYHIIYEGYFREEDFCFVITRVATIDNGGEHTKSEEGSVSEFYRIEE